MPASNPHPPEIIEFICKYYLLGDSYGIISERVNKAFNYNLTRNSMAGVIYRLQNSGKLNPRKIKKPKVRRINHTQFQPGHEYFRPMERPMTYAKKAVIKPTCKGKLFLDLLPNQCKFELGSFGDPPKWFCGAETFDGAPFCPYHHNICYVKSHRANPLEGRIGPRSETVLK